jgi:HSP90 family molecular chaperone
MQSLDPQGFIRSLRALFQSDGVHLRELIQNALEAINQVRPLAAGIGKIEIFSDSSAGIIQVRDDGVGMSKEDFTSKLLHLFHSGWPAATGQSLGIGQFGFGFYAVFLVSHQVDVISRARATPHLAFRMVLGDDLGAPVIEPVEPLPPLGTTVTMRLRRESRHFADHDLIEGELEKTYLHALFPIFLNGNRLGIHATEGWKRSLSAPGAASACAAWLKDRYQWEEEPSAVNVIRYGNGGWLAVAPMVGRGVPPLEIYRRGIYVTRQELVPKPLNDFVCGVVDVPDVSVKPDRESLIEDGAFRALQEAINEATVALMVSFAKSSPNRFDELLEGHKDLFARALTTIEPLRKQIGARFPFRQFRTAERGRSKSSLRIADLADKGAKRVLFIKDVSAERTFADRAVQMGECSVILGSPAEEMLLEQLCSDAGLKCEAVTKAFVDDIQQSAQVHPSLTSLFAAVCDGGWHVLCCEDADVRIPVRVVQTAGGHGDRPSLPEGGDPMLRMLFEKLLSSLDNGETFVVVNTRHPVIQKLAASRNLGSEQSQRIARVLVFLGRLSCGYPTDTEDLSRFNEEIISLIENGWPKPGMLGKLFGNQ